MQVMPFPYPVPVLSTLTFQYYDWFPFLRKIFIFQQSDKII